VIAVTSIAMALPSTPTVCLLVIVDIGLLMAGLLGSSASFDCLVIE
jgi:hypothetical protein